MESTPWPRRLNSKTSGGTELVRVVRKERGLEGREHAPTRPVVQEERRQHHQPQESDGEHVVERATQRRTTPELLQAAREGPRLNRLNCREKLLHRASVLRLQSDAHETGGSRLPHAIHGDLERLPRD